MTSEVKQQQLDWRRTKVLELASEGYSQIEICQKLQLDRVTVHRDIYFLKQQAQQSLQKHIHETVPAEYQKCYTQINQVLKKTWEIVEKTSDEKTRLQALALIDQCNSHKMDMVTNGAIITGALDYVNGKAEKLKLVSNLNHKHGEEVSRLVDKDGEEEDKTFNDVF